MKVLWVIAVLFAAACTKANPAVCCLDPADCSSIGASEPMRACPTGLACVDHECVVSECSTQGCTQKGMPAIIRQPFPIELVDRGDTIEMKLEEYDTRRTIHMRAATTADVPRTPLGYSVGKWDGSTLVVETTRLNEPYLNNTGVPMGSNAKLVERFAPSADGSRLSYTIVITDPDSLTAPVEGKRSWVWRPEEKVMPFNCTADTP